MPFAVLRRTSGRLAVLGVAAASIAGLTPASVAYAANASSSTTAAIGQAQQKLDALNLQADQAVEAYDQAQNELATAAAKATAAKSLVAKAQGQVDAAKSQLRVLAASEYMHGGGSTALAVLLSENPTTFLHQTDLLQQVNRYQSAGLVKMINANRQLLAAQTSADQLLAGQKKAMAAVVARKAAAEKIVNAQQALLAKLQNQAKQEQIAAAAAARAQAVQQQAASRALSRTPVRVASSTGGAVPVVAPPAPPAPPAGASGNVAAVRRYAYAQLGKPYVFGAAGPNAFDCSGLTMRAWQAGGVSLAHSSVAQQSEGARVPLSAMQPGDLVFWGNPSYHVAIYIGGGRIIAAPHTGTVVQIQGLWGSPSMAVRP